MKIISRLSFCILFLVSTNSLAANNFCNMVSSIKGVMLQYTCPKQHLSLANILAELSENKEARNQICQAQAAKHVEYCKGDGSASLKANASGLSNIVRMPKPDQSKYICIQADTDRETLNTLFADYLNKECQN